MPSKPTLRDRINEIAAKAAPSLVPEARDLPPAPPVKEVIPMLADVVEDRRQRLELARMIERCGVLSQSISQATKEKKPLTELIKKAVGKLGIARCFSGDWRVSYYNAPRKSIKEAKLVQALLKRGYQPVVIQNILEECTEHSAAYTLRIQPIGEEEGGGEE